MKKIFSLFAAVLFAGSMMADYLPASSIAAGDEVVMGCADVNMEFKEISTTNTKYGIGEKFTTAPAGLVVFTVEAGSKEGTFAFKTSDNKYLTWTSGNSLNLAAAKSDNTSWKLTFKTDYVEIANAADEARIIWWNGGSPRFACYTAKSHGVGNYYGPTLYKQGAAPAVAKPVIEGDAEFEDATEVSIICETESAKIYYTINGTEPSATSTEYTIPFVINQTTTVKAIAILEEDKSAVVTKVFTKVEPAQPITCADIYQMKKDDKIDLLNDVVVTFANGKNVWVRDASASMLIYLPAEGSFNSGEVLSGIAGTVDIYNGVTEVKPSADQVNAIAATPGEAPAAIEVATVEAADVNKYIVMKGVEAEGTFEEGAQSNLTINGVAVRNQFKNGYTFTAGTKYDIYGVVTIYKNAPQIYFISAEVSAPTALDNTAIENKAVKTIENGMLIIEKAGVRYNVLGQIVR